jgi:hypothetical protein
MTFAGELIEGGLQASRVATRDDHARALLSAAYCGLLTDSR